MRVFYPFFKLKSDDNSSEDDERHHKEEDDPEHDGGRRQEQLDLPRRRLADLVRDRDDLAVRDDALPVVEPVPPVVRPVEDGLDVVGDAAEPEHQVRGLQGEVPCAVHLRARCTQGGPVVVGESELEGPAGVVDAVRLGVRELGAVGAPLVANAVEPGGLHEQCVGLEVVVQRVDLVLVTLNTLSVVVTRLVSKNKRTQCTLKKSIHK